MLPAFDNHDPRIRYCELRLEGPLDGLPRFETPRGYHFEYYRPGDRDVWIDIERSARELESQAQGVEVWSRYYKAHEAELPQRMLFLVEDATGVRVGTATAIYDVFGRDRSGDGWLHWVALRREYQGRGLARPLIARALERLRELGYARAKIPTQTTTWVACRLYLDFGFRPTADSAARDIDGWRIMKRLTDHPALSGFDAATDDEVLAAPEAPPTTFETRLCPVNDESLNLAGRLIREGRLVAFPTETVYGLGANALDGEAVARIFEAKGRPGDNPLIVHISAPEQLEPLIAAEPNETARRLMDAFWPGPMTLIFPKSALVPAAVTAGLDTVAVRYPAHPAARALIDAARRPIAAPSANRSGRPSPTTARHVLEDMNGRIPLILDGGECAVGLESTVIDVTGPEPRILRPGGVTREMLEAVAGSAGVDPAVLRPLKEGERPRSPGMKYRHYAPAGQLTIVEGGDEAVIRAIRDRYDAALAEGKSPLILALDGHLPAYGDRRTLSLGADAADMAHMIFARLRDADDLGADTLFSEAVSTDGLGLAVMNRLGRAAAFHIEHVSEEA